MKQMLQAVVLEGTGRKAILEGYSSAGKTGTAQKVDPATGAYSHTKYVASFAGFAPVNNPAITVGVILDSPAGLHQGGQVAAPVFQRVAQQVLEYLHTPHDVELPLNRQVLLAQRRVEEEDLAESSPDHLGAALELADSSTVQAAPQTTKPAPSAAANFVVPVVLREREPQGSAMTDRKQTVLPSQSPANESTDASHLPASGTVVLEAEQGGIEVPSFLGKSVRAAIELAQESELELDAVGSGLAREQSPAPGAHVAAGSRVTVRFGR
jgi:cell division protein FtsI (penicillin-binding protein 3)